ncbi:hypothetical protein N665_0206s0022 [Sinapis alba]|nr:hypothetical protein N665_0206s0022 [Sinapis alba]
MASSLFIFFLTFLSHFLPLSFLSATVLEDLATLTPPPDFTTTITTNCLHNPLLRYCNNTSSSSPMNIVEIFRSTIVKRYKMKVLVLLIVFLIVVTLLCCCLGWLCLKRPDYLPRTCRRRSHKFTSLMIDAATDEFSDQRLVMKSNGVDIFRGTLRDGTEAKSEVYTEKFSKAKRREFEEECEAVLKLRHKNLVRVLGWCNSRNLRALVTEWTNGENLETWLNSSLASSWRRRLRVVMGVVEGVSYLSEHWPEITFDLNTSSVLLSSDGQEPLISQFKIGDGNNTSTNICNFGLFLLEMITNLKPNEEQEDS